MTQTLFLSLGVLWVLLCGFGIWWTRYDRSDHEMSDAWRTSHDDDRNPR